MKTYKLIIKTYIDNPNYERDVEIYKKEQQKGLYNPNINIMNIPEKVIEDKELEVTLTEEEYKKVKEEVIKIFN